jgi:hypothetical protein
VNDATTNVTSDSANQHSFAQLAKLSTTTSTPVQGSHLTHPTTCVPSVTSNTRFIAIKI